MSHEYYENVNVKPIANEKRRDEENERARNGERKPRRACSKLETHNHTKRARNTKMNKLEFGCSSTKWHL